VKHIMEDKDEGPSKERGPHGWYRHPSIEEISKASDGKTVYLSPVIPI
jgi:hypothetical protein